MQLSINGHEAFAATGGREFDASLPVVVFLHGAGFDHSAWALHSRWFAHHGYGVLAPDLPGHGRSAGPALPSIAEMADWTIALLSTAGVEKAYLVGHSMGSLIALEAAARHPERVSALGLIGTAAAIPQSRTVILPGAGHMLMAERPDAVHAALKTVGSGA